MASVVEERILTLVGRRLQEAITGLQALADSDCLVKTADAAQRIIKALQAGGKVIFCGNGGSSMDAGHLAAELLGRFYYDRPPLSAISLADNTAAMTAIGNDYGYGQVFARQIRGIGRQGDVLVALTTSGKSVNVIEALLVGRELGMTTVALTGSRGGRIADITDICIAVPATDTPRVQEACMHLGHSICEMVEAEMYPALVSR